MTRSILRRRLLLVFAALAVLVGLPSTVPVASAHAELFRTEPNIGTIAPTGTDEILLQFSPLIADDSTFRITVTGPDASPVNDGPFVREDQGTLVQPIEPAVEGTYSIDYEVVGIDGDRTGGTFTLAFEATSDSNTATIILWVLALGIPAAIFLRPGRKGKGKGKGKRSGSGKKPGSSSRPSRPKGRR